MFGDKNLVRSQKEFSPTELIEYMESLLKESNIEQSKKMAKSNYSWLRSRSLDTPPNYSELIEFQPTVYKMSAESCAFIAVQLHNFTATAKTPSEIITAFKNLLEDQIGAQILAGTVKRAKENTKKSRTNRVHPELSPAGRQPTVSFILE